MFTSDFFKMAFGSLVRHLATIVGTYIAAKGLGTNDQVTAIEGGIAAGGAVVWSLWQKYGQAYMTTKFAPGQIGGPGGQNFKPPASVIVFIILALGAMPHNAKAQTATPCGQSQCTGWYAGANVAGLGSNVDVLANGIGGSVFSDGGMLGVQGGYQFWNGNFFFAGEAFADYKFGSSLGTGDYRIGQLGRFGGALTNLFSNAPAAVNVPSGLRASFIAPYIQTGSVEAKFGTGWGIGAGALFAIADHWDADVSYLNVQYKGAVVTTENLVRLSINYKF